MSDLRLSGLSELRRMNQKRNMQFDGRPVQFFHPAEQPYGGFSSFSPHSVTIDGITYPTLEHYVQAMKFSGSPKDEEYVREAKSPQDARRRARERQSHARKDWESVQDSVMLTGVMNKMMQHKGVRMALMDTAMKQIIEANITDSYWGSGPDGTGQNKMGKILMLARRRLDDFMPAEEVHSQLQKCPLKGYQLTDKGIVRDGDHLLSAEELLATIRDVTKIHGAAAYSFDSRFHTSVRHHVEDSMTFGAGSCLIGLGLWLIFYRAVTTYRDSMPKDSLLLTWEPKYAAMNEVQQQELLRRRRFYMQATNSRTMLSLTMGVMCIGFGAVLRFTQRPPDFRAVSEETGLHAIRARNISRWLWSVYYHHDAYKAHSRVRGTPMEELGSLLDGAVASNDPRWSTPTAAKS